MKIHWTTLLFACLGVFVGNASAVNISGNVPAGTYSDVEGYTIVGETTFVSGSADTVYNTQVAGNTAAGLKLTVNNNVYFNGGLTHNAGITFAIFGSKSLNLVGTNANLRGRFRMDKSFTGSINVGSATATGSAPKVDFCIAGGAINYYVLSGESSSFDGRLANDTQGAGTSHSFNKYGAGTLTLTHAGERASYGTGNDCPAYTGTINVKEGTLKIGGTGTLGTATTVISEGATLVLASTTTDPFAGNISINMNAGGFIVSETATISGAVNIVDSVGVTVAEGKTATISGNLTKPDMVSGIGGTLAKYGLGTLVLSGENANMRGRIKLGEGSLEIQHGGETQNHYRIDVEAGVNKTANLKYTLSSTAENPYVWQSAVNIVSGKVDTTVASGVMEIANGGTMETTTLKLDNTKMTVAGNGSVKVGTTLDLYQNAALEVKGNGTLTVDTGKLSTASGTIDVAENGTLTTRAVALVNNTLSVKEGTLNVTSSEAVEAGTSHFSLANSTLNLSGGKIKVNSNMGTMGTTEKSTWNISGGELEVSRFLTLNAVTANISGGTVQTNMLLSTTGASANVTLIGSDMTVTAKRIAMADTDGDFFTFSATGTGMGKIVSTSNSNLNSGADVLSGMRISADVGGGAALLPKNSYTLLEVARAGSNPTLNDGVWDLSLATNGSARTVTATLAEGSKVGTLTMEGGFMDLDLSDDPRSSGWLEVVNAGATPLIMSFDVTGVDDLQDLVDWMLQDSAGQLNASVAGDAIQLSDLFLPNGTSYFAFDLSGYNATAAITGIAGVAVPEPATWLLLLLGLAFWRRKR